MLTPIKRKLFDQNIEVMQSAYAKHKPDYDGSQTI